LRGRKSARRLEKFARLAENRSRLLAKHIEREYATWGRVVNETRIIANWQARGSWRLRSARCIRDSPARVLAFCYLKPQFFPTKERVMRGTAVIFVLSAGIITSAGAQELTWRKDIQPIIAANCAACHGANQPGFAEWNVQRVNDKNLAPQLVTYAYFMNHVIWPETGAIMRRLDDAKASPGGKPGNMYVYLGSSDAERAKNLQTIKAWLGEGAWNLNRWQKRGDTPAISKEQLDKIKAKY